MTKNILITVAVALVVSLGVVIFSGATKSDVLGSGLVNMNYVQFVKGAAFGTLKQLSISELGKPKIGLTGDTISRVNVGTCYIKAYATTITATSTATVDCQATAAVSASGISALTGVTAGDVVSVNLATSTAGTTFGGLILAGASASSTSGYITLRLTNLTGTTYTWPVTGTASGTATYIVTDI